MTGLIFHLLHLRQHPSRGGAPPSTNHQRRTLNAMSRPSKLLRSAESPVLDVTGGDPAPSPPPPPPLLASLDLVATEGAAASLAFSVTALLSAASGVVVLGVTSFFMTTQKPRRNPGCRARRATRSMMQRGFSTTVTGDTF